MRHFINGVEIAPRNIDEIGFISNWNESVSLDERDGRELSLNVSEIVLPNEGKDIINQWVSTNGVFQGIPYEIRLNDNTLIEYYVDLTEGAKYRDYDVTVTVKRRKGADNFFEAAQGTTFTLMDTKHVTFDTVDVPYLVMPPNAVELGVTLSVTIFVMAKTLIEELRKTAELVSELVESLFPDVGLPLAPVVIKPGTIILNAVKLLLQIAYVILLIVALIKLTQQLIELIFPKVRNFKACKVKELISKGCTYLGYTLSSTLLDSLSGLTILPVPLVKEKRKGFKGVFDNLQNDMNFAFTNGYPTSQDSTPTVWSVIEQVENIFNAKTKVVDGVVYIEKRDYWQNLASVQIPQPLVLQDSRQDEYEFNTFDIWKRYYIHYQPDYSDLNTLDNFDNTDIELSTEPLNIVNDDLVMIKGLQDRNIPFSLGTRKGSLNLIERTAKQLLVLIDSITGSNLASVIDKRLGVLIVTNQFYMTSKLLWTVNGKQPENFADYIGPPALWNNYHKTNQIQTNGYKIKESVKILMNDKIYVNLLNNNWAEIGGVVVELLSLEYKDRDSFATVSYREPFDYASANVTTITIDA
jgi:hypothetical protein